MRFRALCVLLLGLSAPVVAEAQRPGFLDRKIDLVAYRIVPTPDSTPEDVPPTPDLSPSPSDNEGNGTVVGSASGCSDCGNGGCQSGNCAGNGGCGMSYGGCTGSSCGGCGSSCGSSSCGCGSSCDSCCCCLPCGWNFGVGIYILKPHWNSNQAFATLTVNGDATVSRNNVEFDYDYDASPLIWLGYTGENGFGGRVRYWELQHNANAAFTASANDLVSSAAPLGLGLIAGGGFTAAALSDLSLNVWDMELSQRLLYGCWSWEFAGGIRYLHASQHYNASMLNNAGSGSAVFSGHSFNGVGPTLSITGRRAVGEAWGLYGLGRQSILVGDATQDAVLYSVNAGTLTRNQQGNYSNWGTVSITEIELGFDHRRPFGCATLMTTVGLVGQYWQGLGNSSQTEPFIVNATDETLNNSVGMTMYGLRATLQLWY